MPACSAAFFRSALPPIWVTAWISLRSGKLLWAYVLPSAVSLMMFCVAACIVKRFFSCKVNALRMTAESGKLHCSTSFSTVALSPSLFMAVRSCCSCSLSSTIRMQPCWFTFNSSLFVTDKSMLITCSKAPLFRF